MKVIFLDIDGVLNSQNWYEYVYHNIDRELTSSKYPFYEFDNNAVERLNRIVRETGAKIVVSSTWRKGKSIEELQSLLDTVGFKGEVIDKTPSFRNFDANKSDGSTYTLPRGTEIDWWLEDNKFQRINWSKETQQEYIDKSNVSNYIILDDDSDMLYSQREHFIQCGQMEGLNDELTNKSIDVLNKTLIDLYY